MADSEDTRVMPEGTTPTVRQDISRVLLSMVDAMNDVQTGLTAFLNVAGDNDSEFTNTAHWMVGRIWDWFIWQCVDEPSW